jgi:putative hydrolase of the HAD superfamily
LLRALLLDAHGTLLALDPPALALRRLLRELHGIEISDEEAERAIGAEIAFYRAHLAEGRDAASVEELRGRCADELRRALEAEHALAHITGSQMTTLLLNALVFRPYPEVPEVLRQLRAEGLRLVVASNWDASLPETLARLELIDFFDGVVTSAALGVAKPDPAIFREALRVVGVRAGEALHVGDSPAEDVEGARGAGIEPVLVLRSGGPRVAGLRTVRTLGELPELVRHIRSGAR